MANTLVREPPILKTGDDRDAFITTICHGFHSILVRSGEPQDIETGSEEAIDGIMAMIKAEVAKAPATQTQPNREFLPRAALLNVLAHYRQQFARTPDGLVHQGSSGPAGRRGWEIAKRVLLRLAAEGDIVYKERCVDNALERLLHARPDQGPDDPVGENTLRDGPSGPRYLGVIDALVVFHIYGLLTNVDFVFLNRPDRPIFYQALERYLRAADQR